MKKKYLKSSIGVLLVVLLFSVRGISQDSVDVTFNYTVTGAISSVWVAGEFNGWSNSSLPMTASGGGRFERTIRLRINGPVSGGGIAGGYMYKFYTGTALWPNDPLNPHYNPLDNNNSIVYVNDPTIYHFLPNERMGVINTSRPVIEAYIFPKNGTVVDTANLVLQIDSLVYPDAAGFYNGSTYKLSYTLPSVLSNGIHKMRLSIGSVVDSAAFSVAANPVQIESPSFTTRKPIYLLSGFLIRPDGLGVDSSITSASLSIEGQSEMIPVTDGIFADSVTLLEGSHWIVVSTPNGRDSVLVNRIVNHSPWARVTASESSGTVYLDASSTTDPDSQSISNFVWIDDPHTPLGLTGQTGSLVSLPKPLVPGEYYFGLIAADPDGHADTTRSYFIVNADSSVTQPTIAGNPEWARTGRIYFLFPKASSSAGTLSAAAERLPVIHDLGFNIVWMMPVMKNAYPINNATGPGYNITDFYTVAPEYGTNQDFKNFVAQAHELGLKVILDVTPNHTSRFHPWSVDAHQNKRKSPYWNWYQHTIIPHNDNGLGQSLDADSFNYYSGFSDQLLNLNWTDIDMQSEMIDIYKFWIKEFGLDGYRFDVYWGPHRRYGEQWMGKPVRDALKHIKPDIFLLAEDDGTGSGTETIYADYSSGGINGGVDAAYDFKLFFNQIRSFGFSSSAVNALHTEIFNNGFYPGSNSMYMRFMESQDEDRIAYVYSSNGTIDAATTFMKTMPVASVIFTIPGIPMIWNGQEVGKGYGDNNFDSRRRGVINWEYSGKTVLTPHYQKLALIRGQFKAFSKQAFKRITSSEGLVYAFSRPYKSEDGIVAVNFGSVPVTATISFSVAELSSWVEEGGNYIVSDLYNDVQYPVQIVSGSASFEIILPPFGSAICVLADSIKHLSIPTDVDTDQSENRPAKIQLYQNYPNPFNPSTTILFELPRGDRVKIRIYDILGKEIYKMTDAVYPAGTHHAAWNGKTYSGVQAGSGVYFVRLETTNFSDTKKIVLIK